MSAFNERFPKPEEPADYSYRVQYENYAADLRRWNEDKIIWLEALKWLETKKLNYETYWEAVPLHVIQKEITELEKEKEL